MYKFPPQGGGGLAVPGSVCVCVCRVMGLVRKANPGSAQVTASKNLIGFRSQGESAAWKAINLCVIARTWCLPSAGLGACAEVPFLGAGTGAAPAVPPCITVFPLPHGTGLELLHGFHGILRFHLL